MIRHPVPLNNLSQKAVGLASQDLFWPIEDPDGCRGLDIDAFMASPWIGLHYRHEFLLHHRHELLEQHSRERPLVRGSD